MKARFMFCCFTTAALLVSSTASLADSKKQIFAGNGHYYQSFDSQLKLWNDAKSACQKLGAHLVTVTSKEENDFLKSPVFYGAGWDWFGAIFESGKWKWVTGEPFVFNALGTNQIGSTDTPFLAVYQNTWYVSNDYKRPYLCEWEPKTYTSVLGLSDLNGNGSPESAALYIDTKTFNHIVTIKDTNTQTILKAITFDTNNKTAPIALAKVSDMDGNGVPEIAVMYWTKKSGAIGSMIGIMIKDASTGNFSRSTPIAILSNQYEAIDLTSTSDITGDGVNELEVLVMKYSNSAVSSQIIDPVAGVVVKTVNF